MDAAPILLRQLGHIAQNSITNHFLELRFWYRQQLGAAANFEDLEFEDRRQIMRSQTLIYKL